MARAFVAQQVERIARRQGAERGQCAKGRAPRATRGSPARMCARVFAGRVDALGPLRGTRAAENWWLSTLAQLTEFDKLAMNDRMDTE